MKIKQFITKSKAVILLVAGLGAAAQAQALYSKTNDFAQFNSGAGTVSSLYYSVASTVNGIGNTTDAGAVGLVGSLQLTSANGYSQYLGGSSFSGPTLALFNAIAPGSTRPYSAEAGYGPGTFAASSGTLSFDVYTGNVGSHSYLSFGFSLDYNSYFSSSQTDFVGADGNTWTHCIIPYTISAASGVNYIYIGIAENTDAAAGATLYLDNSKS